MLHRLARAYGARIDRVIGDVDAPGAEVAPGLFEAELNYLHEHEWARSADDVLWRRSKLGLHYGEAEEARTSPTGAGTHWYARRPPRRPRRRRRMELMLERIEQKVGAQTHLYPLDLTLVPRAVTVLLGATQAGKTTLMRVMAGLDAPTKGRVLVDGADVTGKPVRERNVSMVYQQFINYPSMTVFDNIASPLKLRKRRSNESMRACWKLAAKLHIETMFLGQAARRGLSGGQQQRVALARALAKNAPLMLLDEPLVNLDYKLREELRVELSALFADGKTTVVYATTEPLEALLLGGYTAVLDAGELLQYGPTAEVFHRPNSIRVARAFSDPPMNLFAGERGAGGVRAAGRRRALGARCLRGGDGRGDRRRARRARCGCARRPRRRRPARHRGAGRDLRLRHLRARAKTAIGELVAQLTGVHVFALGSSITLYLEPLQAYVFDAAGASLVAPAGGRG